MTPRGQKYFAIPSQTEMGRFPKVFPKESFAKRVGNVALYLEQDNRRGE